MALEQVLAKIGINPQDFTPGELAAIEDQVATGASVAVAVNSCAPTKSRSDVFSGGNYQWSRNSDGTFNIFDVPVFAKHVRKLGMKLVLGKDGEPKVEENVVNVDEAWLNNAIQINKTRRESGRYLGALHVRHHPTREGEQDRTEPAGKFVLKYVRPMMYDGAMVPVLYADFVQIPAPIFERIKAGLLPYRSIESLPPKFEEIDSIALLDTETPWFRLPMLTPGEEIHREVYAATCAPLGSPLRGVAWSDGKKAVAALCYFAGGKFEEKTDESSKESDSEEKEMEGEEKEGMKGEAGEGPKESKAGTIQCEECGMTHPNDGRHDDEVGYAEIRGEEGEGNETMGKILDALTILCKQNQELLNRMPGGPKPPEKAGEGAPVSELGGSPSSIQSKAAADDGRIAGLEQFVADMKRKDQVGAMVAKAMTDLAAYNLGAGAQEKLLAKALASKEPQSVCDTYVETVKSHGTQMPPRFESTGKPFTPPDVKDIPESCRAYQVKGAEALEKALKARDMFLSAKEMGMTGGISEVDFIKHRVEPGYGAALKG